MDLRKLHLMDLWKLITARLYLEIFAVFLFFFYNDNFKILRLPFTDRRCRHDPCHGDCSVL